LFDFTGFLFTCQFLNGIPIPADSKQTSKFNKYRLDEL